MKKNVPVTSNRRQGDKKMSVDENTTNKTYPLSAKIVCLGDFWGKGNALLELLSGEKTSAPLQYIIPFYQRQYEWQWKDDQLKGLYDSFVHCDENDLEIEQDYVVFGTVQLNETINGLEIIDGQQRLTSFWLLIKALEELGNIETDITFSLKNYISDNLDSQFNNFNIQGNGGRYYENYARLKKELEATIDNYQLNPNTLRDQLLNHVLFSVVITTYNDNIEKTIKLFDSMNTKGLDLDTKDVFKIRYYNYLKNQEKKTPEEIFNSINSAYVKCKALDPMYQVSENDLLDTFKLWIMIKDPKDQANVAKKIKATPQLFFVDERYNVWETTADYKGLDSFSDIAETISQFQRCMIKLDDEGIKNEVGITASLLCTYELLRNSGYWYFRNFMFVFAHTKRIQKNERKLEEADIIEVLKKCRYIWMFCSIIKTEDLRVVNGVLNHLFLCCSCESKDIGESLKSYDKLNSYVEYFKQVIHGDVFKNRQCRFFVTLMYLNDCDSYTQNWKQQKKRIFYETDKRNKFEIEHICSQAFEDIINNKQMLVHHIGNLVFLSARVNKALGQQTAENDKNKKGLQEDFSGKITDSNEHLNYRDEINSNGGEDHEKTINAGIKAILDELDKEKDVNDTDRIISYINKRNKEKQDLLQRMYSFFIE